MECRIECKERALAVTDLAVTDGGFCDNCAPSHAATHTKHWVRMYCKYADFFQGSNSFLSICRKWKHLVCVHLSSVHEIPSIEISTTKFLIVDISMQEFFCDCTG